MLHLERKVLMKTADFQALEISHFSKNDIGCTRCIDWKWWVCMDSVIWKACPFILVALLFYAFI